MYTSSQFEADITLDDVKTFLEATILTWRSASGWHKRGGRGNSDSVNKIKTLGEDSCNELFRERLMYRNNTVNETIPRTNVSL